MEDSTSQRPPVRGAIDTILRRKFEREILFENDSHGIEVTSLGLSHRFHKGLANGHP